MMKLTPFELDIMNAFWDIGECSIRQICESLSTRKRAAYTTIQTIVLRLEQKGAVKRTRKIGNAFLFAPAVTRRSAYRRLVDDFLGLFGGAQPAVAHMLESGRLTLQDLKAVEQLPSVKPKKRKNR